MWWKGGNYDKRCNYEKKVNYDNMRKKYLQHKKLKLTKSHNYDKFYVEMINEMKT